MLLNVSYPNLKPHITELAEFIAYDLGINSSQVRQMPYWNAEKFLNSICSIGSKLAS